MFAAAAAALASFHNLSSQRTQKRTLTGTMAPSLSPPKYKWKIQTGRKLDLVSSKKLSLKPGFGEG